MFCHLVPLKLDKKNLIENLFLKSTRNGAFDSNVRPYAILQVQSIPDRKQKLLLQWVHVDACRVQAVGFSLL